MTRHGMLISLALLVALPARAQHASDRVEGPVPEEVAAWRQAQERFAERMKEVDRDTRSFVDLREAEERAQLDASFVDRIAGLDAKGIDQRALAIDRFEQFLLKYPTTPYASHVRFRLADLYFEEATEAWQARSADYYAKLEDPNLPIEQLEALGEPPKRDLAKALALYDRIILDNRDLPAAERYERLDGTYLMLGFVYNDANSIQYDEAKAKEAFAELIRVLPESDLADRSHLFLGNFAFGDNEFDKALAEYGYVYSKGEQGLYFEEALYQLAWARYKLNQFALSLALFTQLLDRSEQRKTDAGKESAFAPDARRFMAFSFADLGYDRDEDAQVLAREFFTANGGRSYEREVYRQLADVLIRYTRPEEAIATYEILQLDQRWTLEPDNPKHQIALIGLYETSAARDLEKAGIERLKFIERYSEGSPWWEANRNDPEALQVARQYIEASLLDVAIELRVRAQESEKPADFLLAANKYQEYLDKFPISDDYYKQQWYLADSLKLAGEYDRALRELDSLVKSRRYHAYGDAALYSAMDVRLQQMLALGHAVDQPPTGATVERTYPAGDGEIQVFALSPDRAAFIGAADAVLAHEFTPNRDPDLPDYQKAVSERRGALLYVTGQILFYHNRFDEARKRFEELIAKYPTTLDANYAAGLLVDTYVREGNLAKVREYTKKFTLNPPGPPQEIDPERFKGTLEGSTFKLALEQAESGDALGAAEAFLTFRKEFPKSQFGPDALYNAAYYNQQAGKVEPANVLYEQFVQENPNDKRSKGLYFRIAANYEAAFELDKAVDYYQRILRHPDATQAEKADAQYNLSFLLIGLGRHREAAEGFESYERSYPDQEDKEEILWLAADQWEEVSRDEAVDFYGRYKRKYPDASADRFIEAEYRLLKAYEAQRAEDWRIRRQKEAILAAFDRFAKANKPIGANGHRYAAAADFPNLQKAFDTYAKDKLSGNDDKDAVLLNDKKPAELKEFEAQVKAFVAKYQSFEYNSGALLLQARAALYLADLGLSIKCPPRMSEEDCWLFEDILQEQVFPKYYAVEDVGIRRLSELVQAAKDKKRWSPYIDEALIELNKRRPADYPASKRELEGGTDSTMPVELVPQRPKKAAPAAPEPTPAPAPTPTPTPGTGGN